jgi:hypothetical protein
VELFTIVRNYIPNKVIKRRSFKSYRINNKKIYSDEEINAQTFCIITTFYKDAEGNKIELWEPIE